MDPSGPICVVCTFWFIGERTLTNDSWEGCYRVLYRTAPQNTVGVTGVGFYEDYETSGLNPPQDFHECWENATQTIQVGCLNARDFGHIEGKPVQGRHGVAVHEACWSLLEEVYFPEPVPVTKLLDILYSLPTPLVKRDPIACSGLDWGRELDRSGTMNEDYNELRNHQRVNSYWISEEIPVAIENPYHREDLLTLPDEAPQEPPVPKMLRTSTDSFAMLPMDVLLVITSFLRTSDVLNARLAAPSFVPLFYSQSFWASRFRPGADRDWVFEAKRWRNVRDWRWIYRCTASGSLGMQNRRKVWMQAQQLRNASCGEWATTQTLPLPNHSTLQWSEVAVDMADPRRYHRSQNWNILDDLRKRHSELSTCIPHDRLCSIVVSFITLGDTDYIAGIRLVLDQESHIQLGFLTGKEVQAPVKILHGFYLSAGRNGFHALQFVSGHNEVSEWIGTPRAPKTSRFVLSSPLTALKASFDVCKMISLGVSGNPLAIKPNKSLQDAAFWYPEIPRGSLNMNEEYFTARNRARNGNRPLYWFIFGGPGGSNLRHLVRMTTHFGSQPRALEFKYKGDKCMDSVDARGSVCFDVDGPAGEMINSVTLYLEPELAGVPGDDTDFRRLLSIKVATNWGRSCHFQDNSRVPTVEYPIQVSPGTVITGFYWSLERGMISALGVISEPFEP